MLHLRGVGSSRSRVMTGRASGRGRVGLPGGRSSRSQRSDETTRGMRWVGRVGESRRAGPSANVVVVEERSPERGVLRVKRKGKERIGLRENGTNETARCAPKRSGRDNKGLDGGIGRALGRSAARVRETPRTDAERAIREGRNGEDCTSQGTRTLSAWLGPGDAVGSARGEVSQGSRMAVGILSA